MCKAFSCLVLPDKKVVWEFGVDSHSLLQEQATLKDQTADPHQMLFARIEITPNNGNYFFPDNWTLRVDNSIRPAWFSIHHEEACLAAHKKWLRMLGRRIVRKEVVHPFKLKPPAKITAKHIALLKKWDSMRDSVWANVWDSVWASVWDSVWDSVGASMRDSVWANVWDSVWASVCDSVWANVWASVRDSVGAYMGSFFHIRRWKHIKHPPGKYPFQPCVDLWEMGLVPSFDGKDWRLHGGPKGQELFKISAEELRK